MKKYKEVIMKKLGKIITIVLAMALCLFTPNAPIVANQIFKLTTATAENASYQFTAPTQDSHVFDTEAVDTYDIGTWNKPSNNYLVSQQVTTETNGSFHEAYPDTTLSNGDIINRSPYVITTNTLNMPARGGYTTSAITLPANGYYVVEIEYSLKEQNNNETETSAFGTFYLNLNNKVATLEGSNWNFKKFYIHTDVLESATITPELYFGSHDQDALGAIYFNKFTVTAYSQKKFKTKFYDSSDNLIIDPYYYIDLSQENNAYVAVSGDFSNNKFTGTPNSNAACLNEIATSTIPNHLGFSTETEQNFFYPQNGDNGTVMLMQAHGSNTSLTLKDYTFQPKPHEVYMFQFYSIATADVDFTGFYFNINSTNDTAKQMAEQITTLSSYPYHNGWQLNTVFFIAGYNLEQAYEISFSLASANATATGWVCIDEFKIYRVNGSYAANNASATGVRATHDMNADIETADIANGYFELGTSADTVANPNGGYPYPLIASNWTTNNTDNGIVNLHASLWHQSFGEDAERPSIINGCYENNNVYMMHNTTSKRNVLTSPALSTTAGSSSYVSFDAFSKTTTNTKAWIITATTDNDGNLADIIYLGNPLKIETNGTWQHYEFCITEDEYAVSRSYYLRFEMNSTGFAYIDNVRIADSANQFITANETDDIDLSNPLALQGVWQSTDNNIAAYIDASKNGLTIENIDGQKTVVQNTFGYNFSTDSTDPYYEIIITARGNNAYLGFKGYNGLLTVTTDKVDATLTNEYKMYVKIEETTTIYLQITLGHVANNENENTVAIADGNVFISDIKIKNIDETAYNDAQTNVADNSRILVLTPAAETEEETNAEDTSEDVNPWNENWWYLIPTIITALAILIAITAFLLHKIKFDKHIIKKHTSYARDMRLKNQHNKIVAQKATKVDNIKDESKGN